MGKIAHLRKQFKAINTYDYMLIKRRKNPLSTFWEFNGSYFKQSLIHFTQGCFVPNLVEIGPVVLEKKFFKISSMYIYYFVIVSPLKSVWPFVWTNLNPLHPRNHRAKFGLNWPSGYGEKDFLNFVNVFLLFNNCLPKEKGQALHMNKLGSP